MKIVDQALIDKWRAQRGSCATKRKQAQSIRRIVVEGENCVEIAISQGQFAIVNEEDYQLVSEHRWYAHRKKHTFYAATNLWVDRKVVFLMMHRLILGFPPSRMGDHKNRNALDNRRKNLRIATRSENCANAIKRIGGEKYKGVWRKKSTGAWCAGVRINKKLHNIGQGFKTAEEAALAYDTAALKFFGEFARLNFPKQKQQEETA